MIGELLTHKDTKVTRRYAQFLPDTKRKAADLASDLLQAQATMSDSTATVTTIHKIDSKG